MEDERLARIGEPPKQAPGELRSFVLQPTRPLYRVIHTGYVWHAFKPALEPEQEGGGARFDGTLAADPYPVLYAGTSGATSREDEEVRERQEVPAGLETGLTVALCEGILRGLPFGAAGPRRLPVAMVRERGLVAFRVRRPLSLVDLRSATALAAAGATRELLHSLEDQYSVTRRWGHQIRRWAPWAQGLIWVSRWEAQGWSVALFGDRLGPSAELLSKIEGLPAEAGDLESPAGLLWLDGILRDHFETRIGGG